MKNIIKGKINVPKVIKGLSRKHFKNNNLSGFSFKEKNKYNRNQKHKK